MRHLRLCITCIVAILCSLLPVSLARCVDGEDNAIVLDNIDTGSRKLPVHFRDVRIHTYDANKKPRCHNGNPSIVFPGHIKIVSGEMEITQPIQQSEGELKIIVTLEKNSFMVGQVCDNGKSKNSFVPDQLCNFDLCPLIGKDHCILLERPGTFGLQDLPESAQDMIPLGPLGFPYVEGEWSVELKVTHNSKVAAGLKFNPKHDWVSVELASDAEQKKWNKEQETKKKKEEKKKVSDEL